MGRRIKVVSEALAKACRIGMLAAILVSSHPLKASFGTFTPASVPHVADCQQILSLLGQFADSVSSTSLEMPTGMRALTSTTIGVFAPDWTAPFQHLAKQLVPHFEFVRFADSTFLLRITQLELQEIGIKDPHAAKAFFAGFGNLSNEKQLAFVKGILFRVLWESSNHFTLQVNQNRLNAHAEDVEAAFSFVRGQMPADYYDLSLRLLCHYGFRAQSFSEKLAAQWSGAGYLYPNEINGDWVPLHGFIWHPLNGNRLVEDQDWVPVLDTLFTMGADRAAEFFLATHLATLPESVLIAIEAMPALPADARATVVERQRSQSGSSKLTPDELSRNARIAEAESELAIVETRIALQKLVDALAGMGTTSSLVAQLKEQLVPYVTSLENHTCSWVFTSVQFLLEKAGFPPDSWTGQIVGGILSQVLISVASSATQAGPLQQVLEDLYRNTAPIAAFASELSRTGREDIGELSQRQQTLSRQLLTLRGVELLQ
jgi:hypothetical protein